jgi:hypothetical protein
MFQGDVPQGGAAGTDCDTASGTLALRRGEDCALPLKAHWQFLRVQVVRSKIVRGLSIYLTICWCGGRCFVGWQRVAG